MSAEPNDDFALWRPEVARRRAAEALGGPDTVFDESDDQHRVALILLQDFDACCPTPGVDTLVERTELPRAFVAKVVRRLEASALWPIHLSYAAMALPGPCMDVIRAVQVGLGFAIRRASRYDDEGHYELTTRARENIARLQGRDLTALTAAETPASEADDSGTATIGAVCAGGRVWREAAPSVEGTLRRRRGDRTELRPGSTLILKPIRFADAGEGMRYVRFVARAFTAWLKLGRVLESPRRIEVQLLGVSSESDLPDAIENLRQALEGARPVCSAGFGIPSVFSLPKAASLH